MSSKERLARKLTRTGLFMLLVLAVHFMCRSLYVSYVLGPQKDSKRDCEFARDYANYSVLILGNSHVVVGLDEKALGRAANLASLGEVYMVNYYRLKDILHHCPSSSYRTMVLPFSLHGFRAIRPDDYENTYRAKFIDYPELARTAGDGRAVMAAWAKYELAPYAGSSDDIVKLFEGSDPAHESAKERFNTAKFSQCEDRLAQVETQVREHFSGANYFDPVAVDYFMKLLHLAQENGMQVVLLRFPVSAEYANYVDKNVLSLKEWDSFVRNLLKDEPRTLDLDYTGALSDDFFMDPLHLNHDGRERFSQIVREELLKRGMIDPN